MKRPLKQPWACAAREGLWQCCREAGAVTGEGFELTAYGMLFLGVGIGAVGGVMVKAFKVLLYAALHLCWTEIPAALHRAGWTPESSFSLINYVWMLNALIAALVGLLSVPLLDRAKAPTLGAWVRYMHRSPTGTVPVDFGSGLRALGCGWLGGLVLLGFLSVLSGAALGPEPLVAIVPSALAGAFASGPLRQPPRMARAAAVAGASAGLAAFFGLPVASAFMVMELPHLEGMQFALEAMPACMVASVSGTFFAGSVWETRALLGNSRLWFPWAAVPTRGGPGNPEVDAGGFGWAGLIGLLAGTAVHAAVVGMKKLHHCAAGLRGDHPQSAGGEQHGRPLGAWERRWRKAAVLALVGAANGAVSILFPSSLFWGEEQIQVPLTRGCEGKFLPEGRCEHIQMPFLYEGLLLQRDGWPFAPPGQPLSSSSMLALSAVKFLQIMACELAGFVGGAIFPIAFACAALGSAIGATPTVAAMGGQFVYISTAASVSVGLAALMNTNIFAVLFVVVLQANMPFGNISAQMMALLFAVYLHYAICRPFLIRYPHLNLIASQQCRRDLRHTQPPWDASPSRAAMQPGQEPAGTPDAEVGAAGGASGDGVELDEGTGSSFSGAAGSELGLGLETVRQEEEDKSESGGGGEARRAAENDAELGGGSESEEVHSSDTADKQQRNGWLRLWPRWSGRP